MEIIKKIFKEIGREDITEDMDNLLESGIIDSMDIIAFLSAVEKHYGKPINAGFIDFEVFKNFQTIKDLLDKASL